LSCASSALVVDDIEDVEVVVVVVAVVAVAAVASVELGDVELLEVKALTKLCTSVSSSPSNTVRLAESLDEVDVESL
jgi:hypothetical protein